MKCNRYIDACTPIHGEPAHIPTRSNARIRTCSRTHACMRARVRYTLPLLQPVLCVCGHMRKVMIPLRHACGKVSNVYVCVSL